MMKQQMIYEESEEFPIQTLSIIGEFNEWQKEGVPFEKNEQGIWETEVDFPLGKSLYKLIVNNEMTLNDPLANLYAPDKQGELMSVMLIDEERKSRLYNNEQYHLELSSYSINNYISQRLEVINRSYFLDSDRKIVIGIGFKAITGIHTVTVAWYSPNGVLQRFAENNLMQPEDQEEAKLWFWLPLEPDLPLGQWQLRVFIDGQFILKDTVGVSDKRIVPTREIELLPIGSVVLLKDTSKRVMIYGRGQKGIDSDKVWDYVGCLYPEGNIGPDHTFLFDHEQIERIDHKGLQDEEEATFLTALTSALKE